MAKERPTIFPLSLVAVALSVVVVVPDPEVDPVPFPGSCDGIERAVVAAVVRAVVAKEDAVATRVPRLGVGDVAVTVAVTRERIVDNDMIEKSKNEIRLKKRTKEKKIKIDYENNGCQMRKGRGS